MTIPKEDLEQVVCKLPKEIYCGHKGTYTKCFFEDEAHGYKSCYFWKTYQRFVKAKGLYR